ncbi:MAG: trigger factor [Blautia sp.]|nr:trigger factor [Lachnoclostridium sp.]MCM1211561.1 trigger factor [Blautia sp.]
MKKKKIAFLAVFVLLMGALSACGKDDTYLSGIKAADYVTLGEYKGIEVNRSAPSVSEEYVDAYIDYIRSQRAVTTTVTDRAVQEGDTVNIDYAGYRDGVAFDGGTAQGQELTIGSGSFIPGFEEGLIGKNIGDTVTLDLSFPENYRNAEMAGAAVSFEVTIHGITVSEMPELTDAFVQELGIENCNTVEEYRDYIYNLFYEDAVKAYDSGVRSDITQAAMANCIFKEPPEKMVDRHYQILSEGMQKQAASQGMELEAYLQKYYNLDAETYPDTFREEAKMMAEQYIMYQAIADAEGLNLTEEELSQEMEERVAEYGYASVEEFRQRADEQTFHEYLMADVVIEYLVEQADIQSE